MRRTSGVLAANRATCSGLSQKVSSIRPMLSGGCGDGEMYARAEARPRLTAVAKATGDGSRFGHRIPWEDGVNAKHTVGYLGDSEIDGETGKCQRLPSLEV